MPRLSLLFSLLLLAAPASGQRPPGAWLDVLDYDFSITLDPTSNEMRGVAELLVQRAVTPVTPCVCEPGGACCTPPPPYPTIDLNLVARRPDGKGMTVDSIKVARSSAPGQWAWVREVTHEGDQLRAFVSFAGGPCFEGEQCRVRIVYHGTPADGLIIANNKHGRRTFFGDNWPDRARHWLPTVDHPGDKATVSWHVTAPVGYGIIANGRRMASWCDAQACHADYRSDVPLPTKVMVFGAAPFAVTQAGAAAGVPIETWVYEEERDAGFREYATAVPIVAYFDSLLAPFPYEKLANVQSKTRYGGMENAGAIFYHENSTPGDGSQEGLLAHEIVHQWFGDWATEADWPHLWLSEGFATYLTSVWFEHKEGPARLAAEMAEQRQTVLGLWRRAPAPLVDTDYSDPNELLTPNVYQRGAWVLHMLRMRLGDRAFFDGVRGYLLRHGGRNATTADLQRAFETASRETLAPFFDQWTRRAGQPRLDGTWRYDAATREVVLTLQQTPPEGSPFSFPLDLAVDEAVHTVPVTQLRETFRLAAPTRPTRLTLDPRVRLLFDDGGLREAP